MYVSIKVGIKMGLVSVDDNAGWVGIPVIFLYNYPPSGPNYQHGFLGLRLNPFFSSQLKTTIYRITSLVYTIEVSIS